MQAKQCLGRTASVIALLAMAGPAAAGGLYISEYATPSMGTADAGAQAWANNASTAFHNPAGMVWLDRSQITAGAGFAYSQVEFDIERSAVRGNDGGDAGGIAPIGGVHGVWKFDDRLAAGLTIGGITGSGLDYDTDFVGRGQVDDVTLLVAGIGPSIAYKVTDWLSLGAGAIFTYGKLDQTISPRPVDGDFKIDIDDADDTDTSFNLSALAQVTEKTRLGIIYNSETDLNLDGNISASPVGQDFNATLDFILPQFVKASVYHELNDQFALLGSVRWEDWSEFDEIPISADRGSTAIPTDWQDTYGFSLGVHYQVTPPLLLQAGFGYDTNPVTDGDRRAELPIDEQYRFALGAQYAWSDTLSFGGSAVYVDLGDADIDADLFAGSYDTNRALFFALNLGYKF